jgi:Methyltransferase domain
VSWQTFLEDLGMNRLAFRAKQVIKKFAPIFPLYRRMVAREDDLRKVNDDLRKVNDDLINSILSVPQWCSEDFDRYSVIPQVHPHDFMFTFLLRAFSSKYGVRKIVTAYFEGGNISANKLREIMFEDIGLKRRPTRLLEFASGYARISRHLVNYPKEIELVVCDIHDEARKFYAEHLDVPFIKSAGIPEGFEASNDFDVVFAFSFFSHLPEKSWSRWLAVLFRCVTPGGHLIFTTHGLKIHEQFGRPELSDNGFLFVRDSEQLDLALDE